ncbi:MAG TPA: hypothetical protein VFG69_17190, partial [Nannocystaceae bacterium]|nr:hypothetical protein [Nannocystaceae bacterium]
MRTTRVGTGCVAAMLAFACYGGADGQGDGDVATGDSSGGSMSGPSSASASASMTTVSATMASNDGPDGSGSSDSQGTNDTNDGTGDESSTTGEPTEPAVHWIGRYDDSDPPRKRFGWSGVGFVVRFDGTGASVTMDDAAGWWTLVVDGQVQAPFTTSGGEQSFSLATG